MQRKIKNFKKLFEKNILKILQNFVLIFYNKKIIQKTILIVVGILLPLMFVEVSMRVYFFVSEHQLFKLTPKRSTLEYYDNPIIGSALKPNQKGWFVTQTHEYFNKVETNSEGWPDTEHKKEKPDGIYRIFFLGDSFVENFQVPFEERFAQQLQQRLGKKVEIISMGRGNTGTAVQYLILKNYGLAYKPDLVIHMFLTANDIKNNSPELQNDPYLPYFRLDDNNNLVLIKQLSRNQGFFANFKELLKKLRIVEFVLSVRQKINESKSAKNYGFPVDYGIYSKNENPDYADAWKVTEKLILESKKISQDNGARYVLVSLSNNEQSNQDVWDKLLITYPNMKNANMDLNKPDLVLSDFCTKEKIDCKFMNPFFKDYVKNNPGVRTHFFYDGHWTEVGTKLATDYLYNEVLNPILQSNIYFKRR